jgi:hypothetical protein
MDMLRLLATGVVLLAVGAVLGSPLVPASAPKAPEPEEFITHAITTGLTEDGVSTALMGDLGKRPDFLGKCNLCTPTHQAIIAYGKLPTQPVAKPGKGLPADLLKRLKSDNNETRRTALREMVHRYVDREYARRELTTEQKTAFQAKMQQWRKDMSGALPKGQKFCPSCDGACRLAPKL